MSPKPSPPSPIDPPAGGRGPGPLQRAERSDASGGSSERDTLEIYRLLIESVVDYAVFALDRDGHIITWNPGAERLKGYTREDAIGRHFSVFYAADDVASGKPARGLLAAEREGSFADEGWRLRKNGTRFWASVVITALRDATGELVGFAKVTRDLTQRHAAEEALRASEERFRLLVTSVKDYGIFMLDPRGHVISWNEGARRIQGYEARDIIGRHFSTFYPADDVAAGKPEWELEVAAKEGRLEDEGWRLRKDGSRFWSNVVITALRDRTGTLIGFAKVTRDLTERRANELQAIEIARQIAAEEAARTAAEERTRALTDVLERLRAQAAELERQRTVAEAASRAKSDFLTMMSHELRTPLNAIGGYAELIALGVRGPVTSEQRADLERIARNQQLLLGIINDVLNFSRAEAGKVTYDVGPIPLDELLVAVTQTVGPMAAAKGLALDLPPGSCDAMARGDRLKAEQVLLNLCSNAVKFTPAGGQVALSCVLEAERVGIRVADTGPGIPADKLEAVFEPFVQVGRALNNPSEGTGLGLSISRDLARGMGGDVELTSTVDEGSRFTLWLPRA